MKALTDPYVVKAARDVLRELIINGQIVPTPMPPTRQSKVRSTSSTYVSTC
jgi:hypothetical protein